MRNVSLSFALLSCVISVLTGEAFPQTPASPNTSGTPTAANSSTVQKSDLDSLEQNLKAEIQSGRSETEAHITKLESLVTNMAQSHMDVTETIDKLIDKTDRVPIIVSAIAVSVSAFAVFFGIRAQDRTIAMQRKNTLTTVNANRSKDWIDGMQKTLAQFMILRYNIRILINASLRTKTRWPSNEKDDDLLNNEDILHSILQLQLDSSCESHNALLQALAKIRNDNRSDYLEQNKTITDAARRVFEFEWERITNNDKSDP